MGIGESGNWGNGCVGTPVLLIVKTADTMHNATREGDPSSCSPLSSHTAKRALSRAAVKSRRSCTDWSCIALFIGGKGIPSEDECHSSCSKCTDVWSV